MADDEAVGAAGEAAVRDKPDRIAEAGTDNRRGRREHLAHPGAALGPFVANHYDIAFFDLAGENRLE